MTDRRVCLWTAVSSEEQAKRYSLPAQLADCREFAQSIPVRYPGDTVSIVAEISLTGTRSIIEFSEAVATYPNAYGTLETLIKREQINVLICVRRDRLGREDSLIMTIEALCRRHKVKIVAIKSNLPSTLDPTDDEGSGYVSAIEAVSSRMEIRRMQSRRESGIIGRVRELKLFPFRIPWGYAYHYNQQGEIDQIVMDEEVRRTIRRAFVELYLLQGLGSPTIGDILNKEGRPTPTGRQWTPTLIRDMFGRLDRWAGWIEYNQQGQDGKEYVRVLGDYEPMISQEELIAIRAEQAERSFTGQRQHSIMSGIVFCAACQRPMHHRVDPPSEKNRRRTAKHFFACMNRECTQRTNILDRHLLTALAQSIEALEQLSTESLHALLEQTPVDVSPTQRRIDALQAEAVRLEDARKRAIHAYVRLEAITDRELQDELDRIDTRSSALADELASAMATMQADRLRNGKLDRVQQIRDEGRAMLALGPEDRATVNQWLRQRFRLYVRRGSRSDKKRIRVHYV